MSEILEKILSRGYWRVVIRPYSVTENRETRVPDTNALHHILERTAVERRAWGFPKLYNLTLPEFGSDWIGHEVDWHHHVELWRFYQSGQFIHYSGIEQDWRNQSTLWPPDDDWQPGAVLNAGDALLRIDEVFELASRLVFTQAGDDAMHFEISVHGIEGRDLEPSIRRGGPVHPYPYKLKASVKEWSYKVGLWQIQVMGDSKEQALQPAVELFKCFGWEPGLWMLRDMRTELLRRGPASVR